MARRGRRRKRAHPPAHVDEANVVRNSSRQCYVCGFICSSQRSLGIHVAKSKSHGLQEVDADAVSCSTCGSKAGWFHKSLLGKHDAAFHDAGIPRGSAQANYEVVVFYVSIRTLCLATLYSLRSGASSPAQGALLRSDGGL